jgi:hypothetical protein
VSGSTTTSPSGLATCEAIFARCLVRATPTEIGRPSSGPHAVADRPRNFYRRTEEMSAACDVGKGLVNGNPLDKGREIVDHLDGGIAQPLVVVEMAADKGELRTGFARLPSRHTVAPR